MLRSDVAKHQDVVRAECAKYVHRGPISEQGSMGHQHSRYDPSFPHNSSSRSDLLHRTGKMHGLPVEGSVDIPWVLAEG